MKKENKKMILLSVLVAGLMVAVYSLPQTMQYLPEQTEVTPEKIPQWNDISDADPGAGAGGFIRIVIKALPSGSSTTPNSNASLAVNLSDISADNFDENIAHSTKFGIYIIARFNNTQAYCAGNSTWVDAWTRCRITSADLNIAADTVMNRTQVTTCGTVFVYECFYLELNASSLPLMLNRDDTSDITAIKLEAYY